MRENTIMRLEFNESLLPYVDQNDKNREKKSCCIYLTGTADVDKRFEFWCVSTSANYNICKIFIIAKKLP